MGHLVFGGMQRLNIEAARKQAGQDLLQTPNPGLPPSASGSGTPISLSTPDILNSIIAIANPFFESVADDAETLAQHDIEEPLEKKVFANLDDNPTSNSKHLNGGPLPSIHTISHQNVLLGSPMSVTSTSTLSETGVNSPPPNNHSNHLSLQQAATPSSSVESMRSKLIKDSLKLTIQAKRKNSGKEELDVKSELVAKRPKREELTPEDEERRRRRRERNKVAATKCRNKKKEKTVLLVQEAETLETEHATLKSEISQMEEEFKRLSALLASHTPNCTLNELKPPTSSLPSLHMQQEMNTHLEGFPQNSMESSYPITSSSSSSIHESLYSQQEVNSHFTISSHHHNNLNHNNYGGNPNLGMNYFAPLHHQTLQLS